MSRNRESDVSLLRYRCAPFIAVPQMIELRGDMLTWNSSAKNSRERSGGASVEGCLRAFSKLAEAPPARVLRFVQRYGVLALDPLVEEEREGGIFYRRYTESILVYTRLGAIVRRLLAVLDCLTRAVPLTKQTRCPLPDHPEMSAWMREEMEISYGLLHCEDFSPEEMRFALAGIIQELWETSPPRLSTGTACEELPGLWLQFTGPASATGRWDRQRISAGHPYQYLVTVLPGSWFYEGTDEEEMVRERATRKLISYQGYSEMCVGLLPFMEETRPSALLSVLAFQLMQAITLPKHTYYCKQCGNEFQPADDKNAPRRDYGGCCTAECALEWKRAYNRRRYQQRKNDGQTIEIVSSKANVSDQAAS